ncbi:MAG: MoxR family ATPase [Thermomicrobiales bacterium]|nr:MoxR family ATPase [Thermomicrobiales bacterium]MCO5218417.1 MoxR family ATPase [Thermomicrobiales bacterium]MCO5223834.1 MoxR family ATPase [Thermomicrobiales bacterium]MCO5229271.1 MoxR family ATPase [Thermomicrobiales bacterium]
MDPSFIRSLVQTTADNIEQVIIGKRLEVELVMTALLCRGHVLIEDVPGVGKTVLTKAIARSIGSTFRRIQFTPDLLPGDITGVNIFNQQRGAFEFRPGPIVSQMVLADEINRATPKTQSALLEAMEEAQITVDGATHMLPQPFLVLATENPIDYEGTYPLPEAQLDRFLMRIAIGYPGRQNELEMLDRQHQRHPLDTLKQVATVEDLRSAQEAVRSVHVSASVREYIVTIVEATRNHDEVFLGASPRGSIALFNACRAWAAIRGRNFVLPDDVKFLAAPTLAHRIIVSPSARMRGYESRNVVADLLRSIPVPQTSGQPQHMTPV